MPRDVFTNEKVAMAMASKRFTLWHGQAADRWGKESVGKWRWPMSTELEQSERGGRVGALSGCYACNLALGSY